MTSSNYKSIIVRFFSGQHNSDLEAYINSHKTLPDAENKMALKERRYLIKMIDKHRNDGQVIAKLQNSLEQKLSQTNDKLTEQISRFL